MGLKAVAKLTRKGAIRKRHVSCGLSPELSPFRRPFRAIKALSWNWLAPVLHPRDLAATL